MKNLLALSLALLTGFLSTEAWASTAVAPGNLATQTWTAAGSPYTLTGDVTVPSGVTLAIEPGVVVLFADGDSSASGKDPARIELRVGGSLSISGTSAAPVQFRAQSGSGPDRWYGIVALASALSVRVQEARFENAYSVIRSAAPGDALQVSGAQIKDSRYGVFLEAGVPLLENLTVTGCSYAAWITGTAGALMQRWVARDNAKAAIFVDAAEGSITSVDASTFYGNGAGIFMEDGSHARLVLNNSIVSHSAGYGLARNGGTSQMDVNHSNIWGNGLGEFNNASPGPGSFSLNPLYVSNDDLSLTSRSPARFAGDAGQDIGAFPYAGAATPGLHGVLWVDLTLEAGTHAADGDLIVPEQSTLTIEPGAKLEFGHGDVMSAGPGALGRLIVSGTLEAVGTAETPVTFGATGGGAYEWNGVYFASTGRGRISHAVLEHATSAVEAQSTAAPLFLDNLLVHTCVDGVHIGAGTVALDASLFRDNMGQCVSVWSDANATITNVLAYRCNTAVLVRDNIGVVTVSNVTLDNNQYGVLALGEAGSHVTLQNAIVTSNTAFGIQNSGEGELAVTHSNIWNNRTDFDGVAPMDWMSADPSYDRSFSTLPIAGRSPCIDTGRSEDAPDHDLLGAARPFDGDGQLGAAFDMGATEYRGPVVPPLAGGAGGTSGMGGEGGEGGEGGMDGGKPGEGGAGGQSAATGTGGLSGRAGAGAHAGAAGDLAHGGSGENEGGRDEPGASGGRSQGGRDAGSPGGETEAGRATRGGAGPQPSAGGGGTAGLEMQGGRPGSRSGSSAKPEPPADGGCGCRLASAPGHGVPFGMLGLLLFVFRRRGRFRSSRQRSPVLES